MSQNAKIVIESLSVPDLGGVRGGSITVRMNNLNTHVHDSQNDGLNSTLIYTTEGQTTWMPFQNHSPEILYNFSISQNFFQNGCIEFTVTYPNINITDAAGVAPPLGRFYISLVVYDIAEQDLLLKDTPEVDFKNVGPQVNFHNGRIPK
jgi:hypothetical protein